MAGLPFGATPNDTAEYMLGKVVVTPVFIQSNGSLDTSTQHWDQAEIRDTLDKITTGVNWWSDALDQLNTVHDLEFIVDDTFATTPYQSPYEPIDRPSDDFNLWVGQFLDDNGYGGAGSMDDAIRQFNHAKRLEHDADWAFTMFVVDSSDDDDGQFAAGTFTTAFALPGGLFLVSPSTRPASTFAHETGHIFYAMDEYAGGASYAAQRGYYNTPNTNAANNPSPGFVQQPSIMSGGLSLQTAYANHTSAASTFAMIGWQDSDNDGVFDVLDVPLEMTGSGRFDATTGIYRFVGQASVGTLANQNTTGLKNDITLNEVSRIEYRIDGGSWQSIAQVQSAQANLNLSIPITQAFDEIQLRAVDQATGITSNLFTGNSLSIPSSDRDAQVSGFVWLDASGDEVIDGNDPAMPDLNIGLLDASGQSVSWIDVVEPDDYPSGFLPDSSSVTLSVVGQAYRQQVYSGASNFSSTGDYLFQAFNNAQAGFSPSWSSSLDQVLEIGFTDPVSHVSIDATGLIDTSYGRIEAFDANGQLITRDTQPIALGESRALSISLDSPSIASVRVFGHAGTSVALDNLSYGRLSHATTDAMGMFQFDALPDGRYTLDVQTDIRSLYRVENPGQVIDIVGGVITNPLHGVRVTSTASAWQNPQRPTDVNHDGSLSPLDALLVLNELNLSGGSRDLTDNDIGIYFYDVNGNGSIAPIDALIVLNELALGNLNPQGESSASAHQAAPQSAFQSSNRAANDDLKDDENLSRDQLFALSVQGLNLF